MPALAAPMMIKSGSLQGVEESVDLAIAMGQLKLRDDFFGDSACQVIQSAHVPLPSLGGGAGRMDSAVRRMFV